MSLNAFRTLFHSRGLGVVLLSVVTLAMLVTAYTGIGAILHPTNGPVGAAKGNSPDSAVATVDGVSITRQQFDTAYANAKQSNDMSGGAAQGIWAIGQDRMQALRTLIQQAEMVKIAQNAHVSVNSSDIDKAREGVIAPLRKELNLSANASVDEINAALQNAGSLSVEQLIPDSALKQQALVNKYLDTLKRQIVPTDPDVQQYFREVQARDILISNKSRPDAQAKALAILCVAKIKSGTDFASLVKQYSDDTDTKKKGGDEGWLSPQKGFVPEYLKIAFALKAGQVAPAPVYLPEAGYYVIQAVATKDDTPKDFVKNQAKYQQQVAAYMQGEYMQSAEMAEQKAAKVVVDDPLLRAYYDMTQQATYRSPSIPKDFQLALKTADYTTKGEIYANLGMIALSKNDVKGEIDALQNALAATEDAQLRLLLGQAYVKVGNKKDAVTQFTNASNDAYNNPSIHFELQSQYKQIGQTKLAAQEQAWIQQYMQRQKSNTSQVGAVPGAVPITAMPRSAASAVQAKAEAAHVAGAKNASLKTPGAKSAPAKPTN